MKRSSSAILISFIVTIVMLMVIIGASDEINEVKMTMIPFSVFVILASWVIVLIIIRNDVIGIKNRIHYSESQIEMVIERRYDLLLKLINVVNKHTGAETKSLKSVIALRGKGSLSDRVNQTDDAVINVYSVAEAYPNLSLNQSWKTLINSVISLEREVYNRKSIYNQEVTIYNTAIEQFPLSIFKFMFKFEKFPLLRQNPINFDANSLFK